MDKLERTQKLKDLTAKYLDELAELNPTGEEAIQHAMVVLGVAVSAVGTSFRCELPYRNQTEETAQVTIIVPDVKAIQVDA